MVNTDTLEAWQVAWLKSRHLLTEAQIATIAPAHSLFRTPSAVVFKAGWDAREHEAMRGRMEAARRMREGG